MVVTAANTANACQVTVSEPPMTAPLAMPRNQNDLRGEYLTVPTCTVSWSKAATRCRIARPVERGAPGDMALLRSRCPDTPSQIIMAASFFVQLAHFRNTLCVVV